MHRLGQQADLVHFQLLLEVDGIVHLHYNVLLNYGIQSHSQTLKGRGGCWYSQDWSENCCKWFMICTQGEVSGKYVNMEFLHPTY
jgi:hypothetical protein